jgi:hypothetical protein
MFWLDQFFEFTPEEEEALDAIWGRHVSAGDERRWRDGCAPIRHVKYGGHASASPVERVCVASLAPLLGERTLML